MSRIKQLHQEDCRRSDRIRELAQKKLANTEKQKPSSPLDKCTESQTKPSANMQKKRKTQAPQHSERQPKKPCRQRNSAVLDPVTTDQEWARAYIQTVKGSSIHYWIQNNQWPKKLFNSVLGYVLISPPESSEPTEEEI
ncbi:hypothetical protein BO83DRAFT_424385 [Aspergillus eucalypticola CBS 122712]|uniref:Uncharacterized protein n=1 Tax=Aspergillus eucalypticola (strain CBS 122712 / IBT 29274) TaxID=1448314 RepID=A0A317W085_ASPEC|nr:uncharacterized protein BO83DRAFT_424385 [Aspergillus eucalypticola CBS 122712]PWY80054.1 hypothetical protein BO83DRAFT_424385 [Aspergillus eucalypticola CBS 122712]